MVVVMMFVAECVLCCALLVMMCGLFYCLLENCGLHSELREKEERVAVLEHDFELAKAAMMKLAARKHEVELKLWALESDKAGDIKKKRGLGMRGGSWHADMNGGSPKVLARRVSSIE
jgi:hypothetical protein